MIEENAPFPWKTVGIVITILAALVGTIVLVLNIAISSSKTITDSRSHASETNLEIAYITPPSSDNIKLLTEKPRYIKIIDSQTEHIQYAYAPTIIKENSMYYAFFCSIGGTSETRFAGDYIRMTTSSDGIKWSHPVIKVRAVNKKTALNTFPPGNTKTTNASACDPTIARYKGPTDTHEYYYMFYSSLWEDHKEQLNSSTIASGGSVILVARAEKIDGDYEKYSEKNEWVRDPGVVPGTDTPTLPQNPKIIVSPLNYPSTSYGAGQPTVVVYNGKLRMWYADTSRDPNALPKIYMLESQNPLLWKADPKAEVKDLYRKNSNEVKYDPIHKKFFMLATEGFPYSALKISNSNDGVHWTVFSTVIPAAQFPNNAANTGFSSDAEGHLIANERVLLGFGAGPYTTSFVLPPSAVPAENSNIHLLGIFLPAILFQSTDNLSVRPKR